MFYEICVTLYYSQMVEHEFLGHERNHIEAVFSSLPI